MPGFSRFYAAALCSQLGFWASHISYQDLMAELTDDELWVSLLFTFAFGPVLFIGVLGGVLVDRFDRRRVLNVCYLAIAASMVVQVVLVATDSLTPPILLITALGVGTTMAVMSPALQATTADVVPRDQLASAVSLQALASNLTRITGPALVAPVVAADLYELSWGAYGLSAVISLWLMRAVPIRQIERSTERVPVRRQLGDGLRHARERRPAAAALVMVSVVTIFGVSHIALLPSFTADALGHPKGDFVWLGVATGVGALAGALAAGIVGAGASLRRGAALAVPYCALLVVMSQVSSFELALVLQVIAGFFYIASFTTMQVLVQQLVDDQLRGRVMSLFHIAWAGSVPIGSLLLGFAAGDAGLGLGSPTTITVAASLACAWCLATLALASRPGNATPVG